MDINRFSNTKCVKCLSVFWILCFKLKVISLNSPVNFKYNSIQYFFFELNILNIYIKEVFCCHFGEQYFWLMLITMGLFDFTIPFIIIVSQ